MAKKYEMIRGKAALKKVLRRCHAAGDTGLDFETTSLRPVEGRVRLVSLCNADVQALVDFDTIKGGFRAVAKLFEGKANWVVFNAGFEMRWFIDAKATPTIYDVQYMRAAVLGGGRPSLAGLCKWDLGIILDKEEQRSDWDAKALTKSQLDYAFLDGDVTWQLWQHWTSEADERHWCAFDILNDMVPGVIEMEEAGITLDCIHHQKLVDQWEETRDGQVATMRELVGEDEVANLNSGTQLSDYFSHHMPDDVLAGWPRTEKVGLLSTTTETLDMLAGAFHDTPLETFFDALSGYKTMTKYISSFGSNLIFMSQTSLDGRLHPRINIAAAKTCRTSSSGPNVQQTPRNKTLLGEPTSVRASFVAPRGRRLVSYDYSGIELRVLALLSGDKQLLEDMVEGDVHSTVAAYMLGRPIDRKNKKDNAVRTSAKPISFLIIYGGGAAGLAMALRISIEAAQSYLDFWSSRYPEAFEFRNDMYGEAIGNSKHFLRMHDGGTIYMGKNVELPQCANYPVQRTALSVMARAITRHKKSIDFIRYTQKRHKDTRMIATIHDALIDETHYKAAASCAKIMKEDMTRAYLDIFPGAPTARLVEGGIGQNWGELG